MTIRALVIDQHALNSLGSAAIEDEWFKEFPLPPASGLKRVVIGDVCYILSPRADEESRLLIVKAGEGGTFDKAKSPRHAFDRIVHVALTQFESGISIPVKWRAYYADPYFSVYAQPEAICPKQRIYFKRTSKETGHLYVYALTDSVENIEDVPLDEAPVQITLGNYVEAVLSSSTNQKDGAADFGIVLTEPLGKTLVGGFDLTEWYERRLTTEQRRFVDHNANTPVRLKGAAGTGKTVSMAVKCLRDLYKLDEKGADARIAFLSHSVALAHDVMPSIFTVLDPNMRWRNLDSTRLFLGSIYELAQDILQYERKELKPLSTDGHDGREFQAALIGDAIEAALKNTKFARRDLRLCSPELASWIENPVQRRSLIAELLNEFACVIDAEFIRKGTPAADSYIREQREPWQMPLHTEQDRRVVLDIHELYCLELERSRVLSMDQMIADFNRYLTTHEWRQLRDKCGYDLIFVDEFHYFNRSERMTFHSLFRSRANPGMGLPLFMAYDFKQAPNDAFLGRKPEDPANTFKSVRAGETELVELTQVFRCTPEIATFLRDLDGSFPALDLAGEWGAYLPNSKEPHGSIPTLTIADSTTELVDEVFNQATAAANKQGGRHVAVLCMNDELFGTYLKLGRISGKFVPLTSRDEISELKHARKRCILSTPDYVAGLQFQTVFLINVDKVDLSDDDGIGKRRRFVSRCYSGASRASKHHQVFCNAERGGAAHILDSSLASGSLKRV